MNLDLDAAKRALLGTLVGDSLGLPYEKLSRKRTLRLLPFPLRQRLLIGHGFPSDDAVQSMLVVQALIESAGYEDSFKRALGRKLRTWFLSIPPGIGLSTIKACLKLCVGYGPDRSGVYSAGNGAAMRSAALGAALCGDEVRRVAMTSASALVTHTDPLAVAGAQLISLAASLSASGKPDQFDNKASEICPDWPWSTGWPDSGPSGYVVHSVNATIDLWKRYRHDPKLAIEEAIKLGGDTDTVGAMLGGILGAAPDTVWPEPWLQTLGWPMRTDIQKMKEGKTRTPYLKLLGPNILALGPILLFGFRRLLPPF